MTTTIAVVAAHPDDEALGCGGAIARFASEGCEIHVLLLADGEGARGSAESVIGEAAINARSAAARKAGAILGCRSTTSLRLPDNRLDRLELLDVVKLIEDFIATHRPSMLFTHHAGDVNVDHRVAHDAVIAACRPQPGHSVKELLFFETPSSTEWRPPSSAEAFAPNWFVDISRTLPSKLAALDAYKSEMRAFPHPRSLKAVTALAEWRGATVGVAAAEAFMLGRKITSYPTPP